MPTTIPTGTPAPPPNVHPGMVWVLNGQIVIYNGSAWVPLGNVPEEEPEMAEFKVTHKAYNVNTKRLLTYIVTSVEEVTQEYVFQRTSALSRSYDFSQLVEFLDLLMSTMQDDKQITVYDVVGDHRNNADSDLRMGKIKIEVLFKQFNCLNKTKIVFTVERV